MTTRTVATVRPATAADLPAILRVLVDLPLETGETDVVQIDERQARDVFARILGSEERTLLVAELDGEVVGTVDLLIVANLTHRAAPWAILENVCVRVHARRAGIGRALVEDAIARARDAGCYKVQLLSAKQRTEAHELYRSLGFQPLAEGFRIYL